jgi:Mechanosensitive ion channel, conserved TM helix
MQLIDVSIQSVQAFLNQLAAFMPTLIGSLALLVVGWIMAKLTRAGIKKLLDLLQFQHLAERSGVEAFLRQGQVSVSLSGLLSALAYWFVLLITLVTVSNNLGLAVVADLFNRAVLYLPNVVAAVLVLVLGILVARLVNRALFAFLNSLRFDGALTLSTLAEYALTVFVIFMALEQLQISTTLLVSAFQIGFGAFCLALALAFGLGGREWAAGVLKRLSEQRSQSSYTSE